MKQLNKKQREWISWMIMFCKKNAWTHLTDYYEEILNAGEYYESKSNDINDDVRTFKKYYIKYKYLGKIS